MRQEWGHLMWVSNRTNSWRGWSSQATATCTTKCREWCNWRGSRWYGRHRKCMRGRGCSSTFHLTLTLWVCVVVLDVIIKQILFTELFTTPFIVAFKLVVVCLHYKSLRGHKVFILVILVMVTVRWHTWSGCCWCCSGNHWSWGWWHKKKKFNLFYTSK